MVPKWSLVKNAQGEKSASFPYTFLFLFSMSIAERVQNPACKLLRIFCKRLNRAQVVLHSKEYPEPKIIQSTGCIVQ